MKNIFICIYVASVTLILKSIWVSSK